MLLHQGVAQKLIWNLPIELLPVTSRRVGHRIELLES